MSHRIAYKIVLILSFVIFASNKAYAAEKNPQELVLSTTSDPRSFNPILAKETSTTAITGLIFEGLTKIDGITLEVKPNLAKDWKVSDDGLKFTFYLRKNVHWSDGMPFTAQDVLFTFNQLIFNPEIPNSARDIFVIGNNPIEISLIDDYTVRFILPSKFAPFLRAMGQPILPLHKLKESVSKGRFNFTWGLDAAPSEIVGTGPFKLKKYLPGERIILEKNRLYWKKDSSGNRLPYLDKIIYLIVQNQNTALLKFLDGELDYYSLRGMDYAYLKPNEKNGNFTIYTTGPSFGSNFISFNQNTKINPNTLKPFVPEYKLRWFRNKNFRKAIAHAIDKDKIIEIVMNGFGYPQNSAMSPSSGYFYNPDVVTYGYDLEIARKILKEEGFVDRDNDGIIEDAYGKKVEFNFFTNAGNSERIKIASLIRKDLEKLGMKVNFMPLEFNNLVRKLTSTYDWDLILIGLTGGIEPHFGRNVWFSGGHLHLWNPLQEKPQTDWEKRIDEIFNKGVRELNKQKRKILYDEWQLIVSKKLPLIYTVLSETMFAVRNKFGNLKPTAFGGAFHNIEEVYVKDNYRK